MNLFCAKHLPAFRRTIAANGQTVHVTEVCLRCGERLTPAGQWVPHEQVRRSGLSVELLPILADYRGQNPPCEVTGCGEIGTELHHWAPRYLFGDRAEDWPKGYLCPRHHAQWHRTVEVSEPGLPLGWEGVEVVEP